MTDRIARLITRARFLVCDDPGMAIDAVLFDLDGTLIDSGPVIVRRLRTALRRAGLTDLTEQVYRLVGPPLETGLRDVLGLSPRQVVAVAGDYRRLVREGSPTDYPIFDGIPEMLVAVAADHVLAVATSKPEADAVQIVARSGLGDHFAAVVGAPRPGLRADKDVVIRRAVIELGIDPGHAVMVGDSTYDMRGAIAAGVVPIGVAWGYTRPAELVAAGAVTVADTPAGLVQVLAQRTLR